MRNSILTLSTLFAIVLSGCQTGPSNRYFDNSLDDKPNAINTLLYNESKQLSGHDVEILAVIPLPEEELQIVEPEVGEINSETKTFVISSDLLFDFDKSEIKELSHLEKFLNEVVEQFESIEFVSIEGHTDRFGTEEYNYKLGFDRATKVRSALAGYGFPNEMMRVDSFGETQPIIDDCPDDDDRSAIKACLSPDRRVVIKVIGRGVVESKKPLGNQIIP